MVITVGMAAFGCGERQSVVRTAPPAPQPVRPSVEVPIAPATENSIKPTSVVESVTPTGVLVESAGLARDSAIVARRRKESKFEKYLRQLEFEAAQNAVQASDGSEDRPAVPTLFDELQQAEIPKDFSIPENREARLLATKSDLPLVLNRQVVRLINYFTSRRGSRTFKRTMERGGAYRGMIERILAEEGVPSEMFHLAQAESGFRPKAVSRARAKGMWQFVSFRGKQYGLRNNRYIEERYDSELATRAAARHLKDLHIEFGDWYLVMAAYNGGPNRVRRGINSSGSRDYWELSRRRFLRRETRNYVPIILAMTYVAKNEWLYESTKFDWATPLYYDTVQIESEIHIDLVSEITGTSPNVIRDLNPALLRSATPPMRYNLRLPHGSGNFFERELGSIPHKKRLAWRRYQVKAGDTLARLAEKFKVSPAEIVELNGLQSEAVPPGIRLTIPGQNRVVKYYYSSGAGGFLVGGSGRYRIARGDTLGAIARRYGTSVSQLKRWNGLSNSRIIAGRYLIVAKEGLKTKASQQVRRTFGGTTAGDADKYKIRRGDNLSVIAKRFDVTVHQLRDWNGLRGNGIRAGRYLRVRDPSAQTTVKPLVKSAQSIPKSEDSSLLSESRYRIRKGDTVSDIAKRFGVTAKNLHDWNNLHSSRIRAGDELIVRFATPKMPQRPQKSTTAVSRFPQRGTPERAPSSQKYLISRGDTLGAIARRFGVSVQQLKQWNGLRTSRISVGKSLTVWPDSRTSSSVPISTKKSIRYKIQPGDTLDAIARRFGVTVMNLKTWNGLRTTRIRAGKYLTIYSIFEPQA